MTALFTFGTLLRLRTQYLSNRGQEIANAIEVQARGPGRRNNPEYWQKLLDDSVAIYGDGVAYLSLVDQSGAILAHAGASGSSGDVVVSEIGLGPGRGPRFGMSIPVSGWRLRLGLRSAEADSVRNQAWLHLAVSGIAIVFLAALSLYLLRVTRRFVELEAREHAEQNLKALGRMSATLAHEIRNPLGAMKGLTQLAQEELPPDHGAQASMRTVVSEAERLERLVADLLDFARPKKPELRDFDVTELLSDVRLMMQQRSAAAGITLEFSAPENLRLRSDPAGLRQVLLNVLSNALDAVSKGGRVALSATLEQRGQTLVIEVDDTGEGIGDRDPGELFQPFVTTRTRGTGLGLAVSRQIVEALGGTITLANRPGQGTRCVVRLPGAESRSGADQISTQVQS
jgi:two-component system, NtrC family, sensor histidine kinase HydH